MLETLALGLRRLVIDGTGALRGEARTRENPCKGMGISVISGGL